MAEGEGFGFEGFDVGSVVDQIYYYFGIFLLLFAIGMIIFAYFYIKNRHRGDASTKRIAWWEEVNDNLQPLRSDNAEEIVIPGTTLRVFYVKKKDLWLPRFSRGVDKNLFYVLYTPTKDIVNFTLGGISGDLKQANLKYDHTDMQWAAENLREYVKRNFKDKSIKWWQAYQNVITTAAFIMIMTFSLVIIIYFMRGIVEDIGAVASSLQTTLKTSCVAAQGSGLVGV